MEKIILKNPHITEKSVSLSKMGQYVFAVSKNVSSTEIKKEVEKVYKVNVTDVRVINFRERKKRYGRSFSVAKLFKKAVVTLKKGQKIDIISQ